MKISKPIPKQFRVVPNANHRFFVIHCENSDVAATALDIIKSFHDYDSELDEVRLTGLDIKVKVKEVYEDEQIPDIIRWVEQELDRLINN